MGIDNSSLGTRLKSYNFPRLHASPHEASAFIGEYSQKCPGYCFNLSNHKRL